MIISIQNERIKNWKKLHTRKGRERAQQFIIEGEHLVEEAINHQWMIEQLIYAEGTKVPSWVMHLPKTKVSEHVFDHLTFTKTPQGLAAIVHMKQLPVTYESHVLLLDAIQDPGNLGTIIRTADAAGFSAVFLGKGTVDVYNDKVIRATQGSLFHIPVIPVHLKEQILLLKEKGYSCLATGLMKEALYYHEIERPEKVAMVLGNEGAGIHSSILQLADQIVKIPIYGKAESLNVSIAAGILMYYFRQ